jgi:hypothetical protein
LELVKKDLEIQIMPDIIEMVKVCLVNPDPANPVTERVFNYFLTDEKKAAANLGGTFQKIMKEEK